MLILHQNKVRRNILFVIYLIRRSINLKKQIVKFHVFNQLLSMIHQIMRINFSWTKKILIMAILMYSLIHLVMTTYLLLSIILILQSSMTYLPMTWSYLKQSRHFSLHWWLCQVIAFLMLIPSMIRLTCFHKRILIKWSWNLKLNLFLNLLILYLFFTIIFLNDQSNHTWQSHLWNATFSLSIGFSRLKVQKNVLIWQFVVMCTVTMMHYQNVDHMLSYYNILLMLFVFIFWSMSCFILFVICCSWWSFLLLILSPV